VKDNSKVEKTHQKIGFLHLSHLLSLQMPPQDSSLNVSVGIFKIAKGG